MQMLMQLEVIFIFLTLMVTVSASTSPSRFDVKRVYTKKYSWELDTSAMLAKSTFKIKPAQLISRCKEVIDKNIGLDDANDLADDFTFQFPVIGPLTKDQYIKAVKGFELKTVFPNLNPGFCDFRVDPFEPNRVWFTVNFDAVHSGHLLHTIFNHFDTFFQFKNNAIFNR